MKTYLITTDSVTTTIGADSADDAARLFAASEKSCPKTIKTAADLAAWAEENGGWARVHAQ